MGQLSAELNYERRLERYEEEVEDNILNNKNWEEELECYLEEAIEKVEEQKNEESKDDGEHENYSLMLMAANLSEDEKREEERKEEEHEIVTFKGVLLQKSEERGKESEKEEVFPALEMGDYLRDLEIEGIEVLVEEPLEKIEKPNALTEENINKELDREEARQEELGRKELLEAFTWTIKVESERPLEKLFEKFEVGEAEKPIGEFEYSKFWEESAEYEKPRKKFEELIEEFEEYEGELETPKREFEEVGEELREELEKLVEEVGERIEEPIEERKEAIEELEKDAAEEVKEEGEEKSREAEETEVSEEEVEEEGAEEGTREGVKEEEGIEKEEEAQQQGVEGEGGGEGSDGGEPLRTVAAGEEEGPGKEFELESFTTGKEKLSLRGKKLEQGLHWARAIRDDGKVVEWTINVKREADKIRIPKDLKGRRVKKLVIYKYDCERYFPRFFEVLGHSLYFDPAAKKLILNGKEIGIEKIEWELEKLSKRKEHGPFATVKTLLKSIKGRGGHQLQLRLYQDGTVNIKDPAGMMRSIRDLKINGNLLKLKYYRYEPRFPIHIQKLEDGTKYDIRMNVKGVTTICFIEKLREKFGWDNVEKVRDRIAKGEAALIAYFDKGKSCCRNKELVISVPIGSEALERIEVLPTETLIKQKAAKLLSDYNDKVAEGNIGELLTKDKYRETILEEASKLLGVPKQELEMEGPRKDGPDYQIRDKKTGEVLTILDVKSTIKPDEFEGLGAEIVLDKAVEQLTNYMEKEKYRSARFALIARDYYDPWEALTTGGGIKKFKLIKVSKDGKMEAIFEDEEGD